MPFIEVDNLELPGLEIYSKMTDAQLMEYPGAAHGLFLAESVKVIERALAAGVEPYSLFVEERWRTQSEDLATCLLDMDPDLEVFYVTHEQMQQLTGYQVTRGPLAAMRRPRLSTLEELCTDASRVAVLENITNFTNIGAIFRSAAALGVDAVLVTPGCHDPLYKRAARVSMGTVFQVPWTRIGTREHKYDELWARTGMKPLQPDVSDEPASCAWPEEGIAKLHDLGFEVAALALSDDALSLVSPELASCDKLAVVLGTEGDGLAHETIAACDHVVKIPMDHDVDSLNVAAASAVAFWELFARPLQVQ